MFVVEKRQNGDVKAPKRNSIQLTILGWEQSTKRYLALSLNDTVSIKPRSTRKCAAQNSENRRLRTFLKRGAENSNFINIRPFILKSLSCYTRNQTFKFERIVLNDQENHNNNHINIILTNQGCVYNSEVALYGVQVDREYDIVKLLYTKGGKKAQSLFKGPGDDVHCQNLLKLIEALTQWAHAADEPHFVEEFNSQS